MDTDGHHGYTDEMSRHRRPHSVHSSQDIYNCKDAIDREIQCLRAASAAMSSNPPTPSLEFTSWRGRTQPHIQPSPPQPQRYLPAFDRVSPSFYEDSPRKSQGTTSSYIRPHHPLTIPIIELHPPSPEELDPSSIPVIARANQVLQASYRSFDTPFSQIQDRSSPSPSSLSKASLNSATPSLKRRGRADSPNVSRSKDASPPSKRSGRNIRRNSVERKTPDLPPIIETPLVTLDTLYHLVADQAMEYLIRETTLTGSIDLNKTNQLSELSGWSFLGLSVIKAPAHTVFSVISTSSGYSCLHKYVKSVKLLQRINGTMKVIYILCDMDHCSLHQARDFCCVVKQIQQHGRWYIVITSVQHPMCSTVSSAIRGQILCCGVSMEPLLTADGEHCRMSYISQIDLQGDLKPTLVNHLTSKLPLCISHLRDCIEIGQL